MGGWWSHMRQAVAALALGSELVATQACGTDAVRWESEERSTLQNAESWRPFAPPSTPPICPGSLVSVRARGDTAFAAWWTPQRDSSSRVVVARSDDRGHAWRDAVVADSTDRARWGCARPPPFLAADSLNGYVHVVYFLVAPEGPGVFFTHSMEGGTMFHEPVPIVYGERPSVASVASRGDTVAVAYEDPNASAPQIWLALSRSTGHIFDERMSVSSANVSSTHPAVAFRGRRVTVTWIETARNGGPVSTMIRTGTIRE